MTRVKRLLAGLLLAGVASVGLAGSAFADAPVPGMPDRDIGGGFLSIDDGNTAGSCETGTTFFECYGVSGQFYTDPDTGIVNGVGDQAKSAGNGAANMLANIGMTMAQMSTSATAKFADDVYPNGDYQEDPSGGGTAVKSGNWLGAFEPLWEKLAGGIREGFTKPLLPIIASIVLLSMVVGLIRGHISKTVTTFVLAFVAVGAITVGSDYPISASRGADKIIMDTTTELRNGITDTENASSPGYALVGGIADKIIFDRWVAGELGDSTSPTAKKYGPILYKAQAYSWDEAKKVKADPGGEGKTITERKQKEWDDAKAAIKDEDPDAYAYLTGDKGAGNRIMQGFMMNVVWLTAMPMILVSLIMAALAFLIIRLVVVFLPIIALVAIIPRFHSTFRATAELFLAAIVNSVIFGTVATVVAVINTYIFADDTGLDWGTQLLFSAVFTILAWTATSPLRKLTRFATNWDPAAGVKGVLTQIAGLLKTLVGIALTGGVAGAVGGAVSGATSQPGLKSHPAEQQPNPMTRVTYTRDDQPVIDATLNDYQPYTRPAFALEDVVDGQVIHDPETFSVNSRPAHELPPIVVSDSTSGNLEPYVFNDDAVIVPSHDMTVEKPAEIGGTYLVYEGGRYVTYTSEGVRLDEGADV